MRNIYPSDKSREQFASIQALWEQAKKRGTPRVFDLYDVFCAVAYVLKSGCQWRMLPGDLPNWPVVYKYFRQWGQKSSKEAFSLLEQALKKWG